MVSLFPGGAKKRGGGQRTAAHDRFIDTCHILSRNMRARGEDKAWRSLLGEDRKEIGDFACHLTAILGVRAR